MAGGAPTAAALRRRTNGSPAKHGNGATNCSHKNGKTGKTAPRRRGLVDHVNCLIGQEAARDVPSGELRGGHKSSVVNGHAVVRLVALPEAS